MEKYTQKDIDKLVKLIDEAYTGLNLKRDIKRLYPDIKPYLHLAVKQFMSGKSHEELMKRLDNINYVILFMRKSRELSDKEFNEFIKIIENNKKDFKKGISDNIKQFGIEYSVKLTNEQIKYLFENDINVNDYMISLNSSEIDNKYRDYKDNYIDFGNFKTIDRMYEIGGEDYKTLLLQQFKNKIYSEKFIKSPINENFVDSYLSNIKNDDIREELEDIYNNFIDETIIKASKKNKLELMLVCSYIKLDKIEEYSESNLLDSESKEFLKEYIKANKDTNDNNSTFELGLRFLYKYKIFDLYGDVDEDDLENIDIIYTLTDSTDSYKLSRLGDLESDNQEAFDYFVENISFSSDNYYNYIYDHLYIDTLNRLHEVWNDEELPDWITENVSLYDLSEYFEDDEDDYGEVDEDEYLDNDLDDIQTSDSYLNHLLVKGNLNLEYVKNLALNKNNYKNDTIHILYDYLLNIDDDAQILDEDELNNFALMLNRVKQERLMLDLSKQGKKAKQSDRFKDVYIKELLVKSNMFQNTNKFNQEIINYFEGKVKPDILQALKRRLSNNSLTFGFMIILDLYVLVKSTEEPKHELDSGLMLGMLFNSNLYKPFHKSSHSGSQHWRGHSSSEIFGLNIEDDDGVLPEPSRDVSYHANYGEDSTIGWIKFHKDDDNDVIMVEEVQSDMVGEISMYLYLTKKQSNNLYLEVNKVLLSQFSIYIHKNFGTDYKVFIPNAVTRKKYVGGSPTSFQYDAPAKALSKHPIKTIDNDKDLDDSLFGNGLTNQDKFYLLEQLIINLIKA